MKSKRSSNDLSSIGNAGGGQSAGCHVERDVPPVIDQGVRRRRILPTICVHMCKVAYVSCQESSGRDGQHSGRSVELFTVNGPPRHRQTGSQMPSREDYASPFAVNNSGSYRPFFMRNSRTTSAGSRCWPSTASFIARMSSAVIFPASAWRATAICGQRRSASSRTSGTAS